jgi:hypothetical protein
MPNIDRALCPDFTLICENDAKIRCHLLVLANTSELFKTYMLTSGWKEANREFRLAYPEVVVQFFIDYVYEDDFPNITGDDCEELYVLLDYLQVPKDEIEVCLFNALDCLPGRQNYNIPKVVYAIVGNADPQLVNKVYDKATEECIMSVLYTIFEEKLYKPEHRCLLSNESWVEFYQRCPLEIQELIKKESIVTSAIESIEDADFNKPFTYELVKLVDCQPSMLADFMESFKKRASRGNILQEIRMLMKN